MKVIDIRKIQSSSFKRNPVAAAMALAMATLFSANVAQANAGFGVNTDISGNTIATPTFHANSPQGIQVALDPVTHLPRVDAGGNALTVAGVLAMINPATGAAYTMQEALNDRLLVDTGAAMRKFVEPLPGVYNGLEGNGIPVGLAEKWVDGNGKETGDDYYEFAVVEFDLQMHPDLPKATRLRGYVQIETDNIRNKLHCAPLTGGIANPNCADITGVVGSEHIPATYPDGTPIYKWKKDPATGKWAKSTEQVFFVHKPNYLGPAIVAHTATPVRFTYYNYLPYTAPDGTKVGDPRGGELAIPVDELIAGSGPVYQSDGVTPVIDPITGGTMKFTQNRIAIHWHGGDAPWISDGTPHQWVAPAGEENAYAAGIGVGASFANVPDMADPGPGAGTLYFPNNLSGRLMMYHDHVSGLTKVNAYIGEAAGYIVWDLNELGLVATAANTGLVTPGGLALPDGATLASAVPLLDTVGIPLVIQDKGFVPKNVGANPVNDVGLPVQSQDARWDLNHWGQPGDLFFPHVYETNQDPNSADGTNPVGRWDWGPWFWPVFPAQYSLPSGEYGYATATPEAFMDTPTVNGHAYPFINVDPKTYRFRVLSIGNDRAQNLNLFVAVDANGVPCDANNANPAPYPTAPGQQAPATCTEIKMVPAAATAGFPANWPTDGRPGGVPDPALAGPDIVQIGSEGGLLPKPAVWKPQPVTYDMDVRSVTILNVLDHGVYLGPGERADLLVDFSAYAGKTLILYNDAPAPQPAGDPRADYYTGNGDQTDAGGAYDTLPGYGPNTRTVMQIRVANKAPAAALNMAALSAALPAAYAATQPAPIIPQVVYNAPFGTNDPNNYAQIFTGSNSSPMFNVTRADGTVQQLPVINKAIQELFEPVYGRMNATLGVELPFTSATVQTTIPLNYIDTPVDSMDVLKDGEIQIWKITHNGVDSHPVHFHMVNAQLINRVDWVGIVKPPEANETGWKETIRMNPLEDIYVAVRGKRPVVPFGLPKSSRLLDPSQGANSTFGLTNIDPETGQAPTFQKQIVGGVTQIVNGGVKVIGGVSQNVATTRYSNLVADFDNEYVWHCHILGHEENDFMRPFVFRPIVTVPDAPTAVALNGATLTWTDPTPPGGVDANGVPTAGNQALVNGVMTTVEPTNNTKNEIGFKVLASADAGATWTKVADVPANVTSWTGADPAMQYQVVAWNVAGDSVAGVSAAADALAAFTAPVSVIPGTPAPATPTGFTQTLNADGTVTLTWGAVAGATGYEVTIGGVAQYVAGTSLTLAGVTGQTITVAAVGAGGNSTTTSLFNGVAYTPVALTATQGKAGPQPGSITLTWANNPMNVNNVSSLTLTWSLKGSAVTTSKTFAPTDTGATIVNLSRDKDYDISLVANGILGGSSAPATIMALSAP